MQAGYDSEGSEGEEEEDLKKTEWMGNNPPYAEAVEYEEIIGLPSYKISKNPRFEKIHCCPLIASHTKDAQFRKFFVGPHILRCDRYKEAFDDSEYVSTMPDEESDDDSPAESEWGVPAPADSDSEPVTTTRKITPEGKNK